MRPTLAVVLGSALAAAAQQAPPVYRGVMKLPVELETAEGVRLEPGRYDLEVKQEAEGRRLVFTREGKPVATVKGTVHQGDAFDLPATIPLVGTHFLRSSADPLATGQERQFSKTGLPQYMEETRQWRASLRVYRSADSREAWFLFYEVQPRPKRVDFRLSLAQP